MTVTRKYKLAVAALLLIKRKKLLKMRKPYTRRWRKPIHDLHKEKGVYYNLLQEMEKKDPESFKNYLRMPAKEFHELEELVTPYVQRQDTNMRDAIVPGERLAVTLRFLATGETFKSLAYQFCIGETTIAEIVPEMTEVIVKVLKEKYLKEPSTTEEWEQVMKEFWDQWNYPACGGALDGKHIHIIPPSHQGSVYYNYKGWFSIILMALVDANYRFMWVDVGRNGRCGDGGVFRDSDLNKGMKEKTLSMPESFKLPNTDKEVSCHIIADAAFPLRRDIMKPFGHRHLELRELIFDYRLSRARRVVENAFGIMANRFRVLLSTINLHPDKVDNIVLACCCLHNMLRTKTMATYIPPGVVDSECPDTHTITEGAWREDAILEGLHPTQDRNPTVTAKEQRNLLADYFLNEGRVPWQERMALVSKRNK